MRVRVGVAATAAVVVAFFASVIPAGAVANFGDVAPNEFYSRPIQWMVNSGITEGTAPGCFSPGQATTRAEVAAFIHRYHGEPYGWSEPFTDVDTDDWFRDPVAWMVQEGLTTGTSPTTFAPDRFVTRGELAAFIHRAEGEPWAPAAANFVDVASDSFFAAPVAWMVHNGITNGTSATTFEPNRFVTRGEIATFLYRVAGEPSVVLTTGGTCGSEEDDQPDEEANDLAAAEADSFLLLNELRASLGLGQLVRTEQMDAFARNWSETMDSTESFSHSQGPYAENIAWWSASGVTPQAAAQMLHDLWVDSSGHYANMTRSGHTVVGVGFWRSADGWHATHVFG